MLPENLWIGGQARGGRELFKSASISSRFGWNSVLINNAQGNYMATNYLISITGVQPGYLQSSYPIYNFAARQDGYFKAIKENGMSKSRSIIHKLSPSIEDAMADMLENKIYHTTKIEINTKMVKRLSHLMA